MSKADEYAALRAQGMTYQQIADRYGCSYQNIAQALAGSMCSRFRPISQERVVFDGLRGWMNENRCGTMELLKRVHGKYVNGSTGSAFREKLRGNTEFKKSDIDAIIRVTGRTYEELFSRGGAQ